MPPAPPPLPRFTKTFYHQAATCCLLAPVIAIGVNLMITISRGTTPVTSRLEALIPALLLGGIMLLGAISGIVSLFGIPRYGKAGILWKSVTGLVIFTLIFVAAIPAFIRGRDLARRRQQQLSAPAVQPQTVDRVRAEVAKVLKKDAALVDVTQPLTALGADELDVVEIVMAVEEAFKVEIPDSVIGEKPGDVSKSLTVLKLAEYVSKQPPKPK